MVLRPTILRGRKNLIISCIPRPCGVSIFEYRNSLYRVWSDLSRLKRLKRPIDSLVAIPAVLIRIYTLSGTVVQAKFADIDTAGVSSFIRSARGDFEAVIYRVR